MKRRGLSKTVILFPFLLGFGGLTATCRGQVTPADGSTGQARGPLTNAEYIAGKDLAEGQGVGDFSPAYAPNRSSDLSALASDASTNPIQYVARQSERLTKEALKLAAKGATYSARANLTEALEAIADSLDAANHTRFHSRALAAGLTALREADDFLRPSSGLETNSDPLIKAVGHSTPVLKNIKRREMTRLEALQAYYSYATCQLGAAVAGIPEASTALCYLGRLQQYTDENSDQKTALGQPKSLALYQAAVLADARNYRAANDLGVVLAGCGRLDLARKAFIYSAKIESRPETLQNLAVVYQQLGDKSTAQSLAARAAKINADDRKLRGNRTASSEVSSLVYWVDHKTFVSQASATEFGSPPVSGTEPAALNPAASETPVAPPSRLSYLRDHMPLFARSNPPANGAAGSKTFNIGKPAKSASLGDSQSGGAIRQVALQEEGSTPQEFLGPPTWEVFAQGEYVGPARLAHVHEYYLRVDDHLNFVFRLTGKPSASPYRLNVGDVIRISSLTMPNLSLDTLIQPDGTILLPQIGAVVAAGKTFEALRAELDDRFRKDGHLREPAITVVPVTVNKTLEELRNAIINRSGIYSGQSFNTKISPNGMLQIPAIGNIPAQGLTLKELRDEIEPRFAEVAGGLEVTPVLMDRAPRAIYVLGEVARPGRIVLEAPTTVIQAIAMAGSWNIGGNVKSVIVFRRDDNWRLMATCVNVRPALYNYHNMAADDIWLRDSDIVIVPKYPIQVADDIIQLWFTKGIYGIIPFQGVSVSFFHDLATLGQVSTP